MPLLLTRLLLVLSPPAPAALQWGLKPTRRGLQPKRDPLGQERGVEEEVVVARGVEEEVVLWEVRTELMDQE